MGPYHMNYYHVAQLIYLFTHINSFVLNTRSSSSPSSFSSSSLLSSCAKLLQQQQYQHQNRKVYLSSLSSSSDDDNNTNNVQESNNNKCDELDIVLFGIGDLRIKDHGGIYNTLLKKKNNSNILPLLILDSKNTLPNIPGVNTHTINLSIILSSALLGLQKELKEKLNLELCIYTGDTIQQCLLNVLDEVNTLSSFENVNIHVCDLGDADISMNYHPYSFIYDKNRDDNDDDFFQNYKNNINIKPWKCMLRSKPWEDTTTKSASNTKSKEFPTSYPDYYEYYCDSITPDMPYEDIYQDANNIPITTMLRTSPSHVDATQVTILSILLSSINDNAMSNKKQEQNTGLYGTHWGGVNNGICTEEDTWEYINSYISTTSNNMDDDFLKSDFIIQKYYRNIKSLEHASLSWMMNNNSNNINNDKQQQQFITSKNLIDGELMTRYLAAPLFFGCISCRQLWHASASDAQTKSSLPNWFPTAQNKINSLQEIAEFREWHMILAQYYIQNDPQYSSLSTASSSTDNNNNIQYKYWRYHGFLARYATTTTNTTSTKVQDTKEEEQASSSLILVHGFGASSSQWKKMIDHVDTSNKISVDVILAPDLLGFGQSEKPNLTYTQYLWEGFVREFIKEKCSKTTDKFFIAGNSIGGYTSMSVAADDSNCDNTNILCTATGAPGTGKCNGVILLNSAGKLYSKEEINNMENNQKQYNGSTTIAQATITDNLGLCSPPPKIVASLGGKALLWYLRPRIQSICVNVYPSNPDAVDETLCSNILRDSLDPGAINVMISGSKLPSPRTANELLNADFGNYALPSSSQTMFNGPVLIFQGMKDPLNDATGRAYMFQNLRKGIDLTSLDDGGHCPHDEKPFEVANAIINWINSLSDDGDMFDATSSEVANAEGVIS